MKTSADIIPVHPPGEVAVRAEPHHLDTFDGRVHVDWDLDRPCTPMGQAAYFIDFLKTSGRFEYLVDGCPLTRSSPNASSNRDVCGTWMLSVLAGHSRYAHVATLRGDPVLPELLGMNKIVSEDALRRALSAMPEETAKAWLERNLEACAEPLLAERYIMDIDSTVKPIYGRQEGAVVGYNPTKPGRPSHVHHTYMIAGLRLVMGVETVAGNAYNSCHAVPGLWALVDRLPAHCKPSLLRGDRSFGTETIMSEAEQREQPYLFKLRLTKNVKRLIHKTAARRGWKDAGHGWQERREALRLDGWSRERDVVILRRRIKGDLAAIEAAPTSRTQMRLSFAEIEDDTAIYEYAVLVTSLKERDIHAVAQLYRDRADCENVFDELKNQWGWGGFTTQDLARCRLTALMVALVFNWWNIYCRLANGDSYLEATSSRPLLLSGVGQRVEHGRQTTLKVTSTHAKAGLAAKMLGEVTAFLRRLANTAEQLTTTERWSRILAHAARAWLGNRPLKSTHLLLPT